MALLGTGPLIGAWGHDDEAVEGIVVADGVRTRADGALLAAELAARALGCAGVQTG